MPFNSIKYLLFLPLVYLIFFVVGERSRWVVLLAASLLFYAALNVPYLLLVLLMVTLVTYCFGIWLDAAKTQKTKRILLWSGVVANVLVLVVMKYMPFIADNMNAVMSVLSLDVQQVQAEVFVAIGVSYFIFQAMSYLYDIYLELDKPERHFGYFALYLAFFPKLLQGPIERSGDLIPQLKSNYTFNFENIRFGLILFAWGLFKKIVIADRLGAYVDVVYGDLQAFTGLPLLLATYAYAFQIYMDFSGYTDMALGSAKIFNINLIQNFNSPYIATSVADFWRRWHISFSRWILDYIFKPLQMQWRDWKNWGTAAALIVAFIISGIWHGASWCFVIWGGLHGLYLASSVFYKPYQKKVHKALGIEKTQILKIWQIFLTFNLVSFAWIFFRTATIKDATYVISNLFVGSKGLGPSLFLSLGKLNLLLTLVSLLTGCLLFTIFSHWNIENLGRRGVVYRYSVYYLLTFSIFWLSNYTTTKSFIYFQF